jgi:16S rRNA (cytosine1402-N4)-methyltransferase
VPAPHEIHATVLKEEVVRRIQPKPGGRYLDGTLGLGGHTEAILEAAGGQAEVLGLDRDTKALEQASERLAAYGDRVRTAHLPFSRFEEALAELGWDGLDGAVLDLGVSSLQLDDRERGFSFMGDGPLDMRMDPESGAAPARVLVNKGTFEELRRIIKEYGDEPLAGKIARAIVKQRMDADIETTAQLAELVSRAYPPDRRRQARNHPATRTFMALRIAVNREVEELAEFLRRMPGPLKPGGRLAVISFHSLEDRMVKHAFRDWARDCVCPPRQMICTCRGHALVRLLTKKPVTATEEEVAGNPRARSAKLRVCEKLPGEAAS